MNLVNEYGMLNNELHRQVWFKASPMKHRLLDIAITTYPGDVWDGGKEWRKRIVRKMRSEDGYGNPLLIIILVPLAQLLVKYLIEWLLERRENRDLMMRWHYAAKG